MLVHEEREVDSTTGEEARGEESSYEDAHEGLCWQREECSWRTSSLWNCFRIKLRVWKGRLKRIPVDETEETRGVMEYLLASIGTSPVPFCNFKRSTLFNGSTFARPSSNAHVTYGGNLVVGIRHGGAANHATLSQSWLLFWDKCQSYVLCLRLSGNGCLQDSPKNSSTKAKNYRTDAIIIARWETVNGCWLNLQQRNNRFTGTVYTFDYNMKSQFYFFHFSDHKWTGFFFYWCPPT